MINPKKNPIIFGTLLLTASGLICRGIGFFYRLFLSHAFGEESMGIFQLTSPVIMLAFSLACAGMQTAISRFTASCLALGQKEKARKYLLSGCAFSLTVAICYSLIVYRQADYISAVFLKESRCAPMLRICALSFPLSALHSCLNGYFYGKKETRIPSLVQLLEQLVRVGSVFFLYFFFLSQGKEPSISLTCVGMFLGELLSCVVSVFAYSFQNIHSSTVHNKPAHNITYNMAYMDTINPFSALKQLLGLSLPLTFNRVVVNLLQSLEAVSIPSCLKQYGYSTETALSIYGVLTGMALSLVLFPSTFTNSASVLILPAVSEAASAKDLKQVSATIRQSVRFSISLGLVCTALFLFLGEPAGIILFDSTLASTFIKQLSFLCPFLYLHTTLSSILNGLKKTGLTLVINITALLLRLGFTLFAIPTLGITGYLIGLLCSELFCAGCCLWSLRRYFL